MHKYVSHVGSHWKWQCWCDSENWECYTDVINISTADVCLLFLGSFLFLLWVVHLALSSILRRCSFDSNDCLAAALKNDMSQYQNAFAKYLPSPTWLCNSIWCCGLLGISMICHDMLLSTGPGRKTAAWWSGAKRRGRKPQRGHTPWPHAMTVTWRWSKTIQIWSKTTCDLPN